jgi:hypothetical protein
MVTWRCAVLGTLLLAGCDSSGKGTQTTSSDAGADFDPNANVGAPCDQDGGCEGPPILACPGQEFLPGLTPPYRFYNADPFYNSAPSSCVWWDCDAGPPASSWTAGWRCFLDAAPPPAPDAATACGSVPPDYDGCLEWWCDPNAQPTPLVAGGPHPGSYWRGRWQCTDCKTDCEPDGAAPDGSFCQFMRKPTSSCYCDPKAAPDAGGWVCTQVVDLGADGGE